MDIDRYLKRINFSTSPKVDLKTLISLQNFHLKSIPFENLDIHFNNPIILNIDNIYDKIINKNRGGFCYELNGLFYHLLQQLGFEVKMISAEVFGKNGVYSEDFDHMGIIANIRGQSYLVDVGFGKFSFNPLKVEIGKEIKDKFGSFTFRQDGEYFIVCEIENGALIPQYRFRQEERKLLDFENMCNYHQSNPNSHFKQNLVVTIITETGRNTLNKNQYKTTSNGQVKLEEFDENDFELMLNNYFKMKVEKTCC